MSTAPHLMNAADLVKRRIFVALDLEEEEPNWLTPSVQLSKMECSEDHILGWTEVGVALMNREGTLIVFMFWSWMSPVVCFLETVDGFYVLMRQKFGWSIDGDEQYISEMENSMPMRSSLQPLSWTWITPLGLKAMDRIEFVFLKNNDLLQSMPEPLV